MKITSQSFTPGGVIASEFAMGKPVGDSFGFAGNRNPQLTFSQVPTAARSLVLLCVDPDVPTVAEMVGKSGVEIPVDQPRCDFVHWLMIDIAADCREIAGLPATPTWPVIIWVTTARSRHRMICACTAISFACLRLISPPCRCRHGLPLHRCSRR